MSSWPARWAGVSLLARSWPQEGAGVVVVLLGVELVDVLLDPLADVGEVVGGVLVEDTPDVVGADDVRVAVSQPVARRAASEATPRARRGRAVRALTDRTYPGGRPTTKPLRWRSARAGPAPPRARPGRRARAGGPRGRSRAPPPRPGCATAMPYGARAPPPCRGAHGWSRGRPTPARGRREPPCPVPGPGRRPAGGCSGGGSPSRARRSGSCRPAGCAAVRTPGPRSRCRCR